MFEACKEYKKMKLRGCYDISRKKINFLLQLGATLSAPVVPLADVGGESSSNQTNAMTKTESDQEQ